MKLEILMNQDQLIFLFKR